MAHWDILHLWTCQYTECLNLASRLALKRNLSYSLKVKFSVLWPTQNICINLHHLPWVSNKPCASLNIAKKKFSLENLKEFIALWIHWRHKPPHPTMINSAHNTLHSLVCWGYLLCFSHIRKSHSLQPESKLNFNFSFDVWSSTSCFRWIVDYAVKIFPASH